MWCRDLNPQPLSCESSAFNHYTMAPPHGKGQNYKYQNVISQKFVIISECWKSVFVIFKLIRTQKWSGWPEHQKTFDILIIQNAIGNIRTLKVLVHFLPKNLFNILSFPMASEKIRMSKATKISYLWCITYGYQGLWVVRLGSIRLG
jgi:hypothetical protein